MIKRLLVVALISLLALSPAAATFGGQFGFRFAGQGIFAVANAEAGDDQGDALTLTFSSAPMAGDVSILCAFHKQSAYPTLTTSGYTSIAQAADPGSGAKLQCWHKAMGATPDTNVIVADGGSGDTDGMVAVATVFRGVNTTVLDAAAIDSDGASTNPDAPSITPVTPRAVVLPVCGSVVVDTSIVAPTGFSGQIDVSANGTDDDATIGMAYMMVAVPAATDPAAWTTWSTANWTCLSIALRPAF